MTAYGVATHDHAQMDGKVDTIGVVYTCTLHRMLWKSVQGYIKYCREWRTGCGHQNSERFVVGI